MNVMTQLALSIGMLLLAVGVANAQPAQVDVQWHDIDVYTDFESVNQPKEPFATQTKTNFTQDLQELAAGLPAGHRLEVAVEDVDLRSEERRVGIAGRDRGWR